MPKFQVFKSVGEVFSGVTRHYFDLIWTARFAVAVFLAATAVLIFRVGVVTPDGVVGGNGFNGAMLAYAMARSSLLVFVAFIALVAATLTAAVQWHRFVLLGERSGPVFGQFKVEYFWTAVKLGVVGFVVIVSTIIVLSIPFAFGLLGGSFRALNPFGVLVFIGCIYIFLLVWTVRASLALPDVALGGTGSVFNAWEKTEDSSFRLLGYSLLIQIAVLLGTNVIPLLVFLLVKMLSASLITSLEGMERIVTSFLCLPLQLYALMIAVTMLSVAYREIIGLPVAPDTSADAASPAEMPA
ncbi:MAG: hypothetical protein ACOH12_08095 [Parvibaculaceae bacterium]